ncbi:cyclase family protein [Pyrinomonas methylaliphatogenes]|uniref:Kynurenine formamidase n=1 Tax=Pyrinomonas methylaliphatogenes TaxID=454194 RepID=A0A0B6WSP9_9BACT|nr:cyclase family protein [Pyrinomonas methylaliphatogenes]CDM64258.1 Kynurenine formamidase [Pyrinomonas methylaliphatogenes]
MRIYDISVPIRSRTPVYPGDPPISIETWMALARGDVANVSQLRFGAHTGTHVDAPAHFISDGMKAEDLPLEALIGEAVVVEVPEEERAIEVSFLEKQDLPRYGRILFRTRNSSWWKNGTDRFREDYVYLTPEAARALVERGTLLVGIDYLSIEGYGSTDFPTHKILLNNGVVIVEGLNLSEVPGGIYELVCLPLLIAEGAGDGAPARAVLIERARSE